MVISALFVLDLKGKVIIARHYRGDIPASAVERFLPLMMESEERDEAEQKPFLSNGKGLHYVYIKHNNLYLLAMTRRNSNAATILLFLENLIRVFKGYFQTLEEESIRDNFVIIYELLDEMLDYGYPQTTEQKILQEYITQESHALEIQTRPPSSLTGPTPWRPEGIKYRKNEVFLDVIESVNVMANSNGNVLKSEVLGSVKMRCCLSGMPDLRLGLNDKVLFENQQRGGGAGAAGSQSGGNRGKAIEMEDVKFHQCVKLARFETDRTISFVPPDGDFELMSYRIGMQVKPLIWCEATVERYSASRLEYMIKAKSQFKRRSSANNVEILVPVPEDADSPKFKASTGYVSYAPERNACIWKIKQFPGGKEYVMRAHFGLPSVKNDDVGKRPPIRIKFEIPYFTVSGIQVRYLKIVERSGYHALPWVRYITQNGEYSLRLPEPVKSGNMVLAPLT